MCVKLVLKCRGGLCVQVDMVVTLGISKLVPIPKYSYHRLVSNFCLYLKVFTRYHVKRQNVFLFPAFDMKMYTLKEMLIYSCTSCVKTC